MARYLFGRCAPTCLVCLTAALLLVQGAHAQLRPRWNRKIQGVAVFPSAASTPSVPLHDIHVSWSFEAENLAGALDLSTHLRIQVNGEEIGSAVQYAIVVNQLTTACQPGPPCAGSCGSYTLDGVSGLDLICFKDGACSPGSCDCDCGAWLTARVLGVSLAVGDQITVRIDPAPSSASDDPSDNLRSFPFNGGMIGWNRGLSGVSARLSPDGDSMYVRVSHYVEFDGPSDAVPTDLNLDAEVEFYQQEQFLGSQRLELGATYFGMECAFIECLSQQCGEWTGHPGTQLLCKPPKADPDDCVCQAVSGGDIPEAPTTSPTYLDQPFTAHIKSSYGALPEFLTNDDSAITLPVSVSRKLSASDARLLRNFPNPFSPRTTIAFRVEAPSAVVLEIFDLAGRHVRTLARGLYPAGESRLEWDGRTDRGERVPAGPYLYRLNVNGHVQARKLTILGT